MSRLACAYSETTNLTGSVLLELNQELGGGNLMTIDYLWLKEHMGCEQIPEMGCFNLSDGSSTVGQYPSYHR